MPISLSEDFKTLAELAHGPDAIVDLVQKNRRPVIVTRDGKPAAVMLGVKEYEWLIHLLNLSRMLHKAEADIRAGRTRPAEEVFRELRSGRKKKSG